MFGKVFGKSKQKEWKTKTKISQVCVDEERSSLTSLSTTSLSSMHVTTYCYHSYIMFHKRNLIQPSSSPTIIYITFTIFAENRTTYN